ncbi:RNA-binding motif protein, X-linked 2-like [Lutzomyia longipalpis]|uniref:RNA-binding motif protein, X-linked 2-like n=1 Tax=Lutzomyia longipalpis TaxID=7200 RepID=UPI002483BAFB|nr:RNA-binding motif protein, X-linked 2-like [Lutzomyia longipalpis]
MNPLTNMKNVLKLSENDLKGGSSWHDQYRNSAWIFVGGLPYDLTEGDVIAVFSQYGEIVNINLVRDKVTGKQKGFCFLCYEDQRSTILAVDNLNGIKLLGKTLRVDHVSDYKAPKDNDKMDEETRLLHMEGCAPKPQIPVEMLKKEHDAPPQVPEKQEFSGKKVKKEKKAKKSKKTKKRKKRKSSSESSESNSSASDDSEPEKRRKKK